MTVAPARTGIGIRAMLLHEFVEARKYWTSVLLAGLLTPLLYVLALGIGLGTVVNAHSAATGGGLGVRYVVFVAPAFLTAAALQTATASATWPVTSGFEWLRYYHGMAATPLSPRQIADGKLAWIALRTLVSCVIYLGIMACFGAVVRWQALFEIPVGMLTGVAFAAPVLAVSATVPPHGQAFNVLFRFVVTPMFLFSGTFYPIDRLPVWGQVLAHVSPLWHGTQLARAAAIGGVPSWALLAHVAYLLVWLVAGAVVARWRFAVRLTR